MHGHTEVGMEYISVSCVNHQKASLMEEVLINRLDKVTLVR